MARTIYRPETDGFAFGNHWTWDDLEKQQLHSIIAEVLPIAEAIAAPIIAPIIAPFVIAQLGIFGLLAPLVISAKVQSINNAVTNAITNAVEANDGGIYGLCGGMTFASLDYWRQGWVVPRGTGPADQPTRDTPQGTALRNYL